MHAITIRISGSLSGKPELSPLIIELRYLHNAYTFTPYLAPAHPLFLVAMTPHLITALVYATTANDLACLLTTLLINKLHLMLLSRADQRG
jgi:hypothetical protein